jgi:23S rRNA (uracil1939-C5)-methyltransferase
MDEYQIKRLGHHGDGIAEGPVYAPVTLPGEVVTGKLDGQNLRDVRIVTPSEAPFQSLRWMPVAACK